MRSGCALLAVVLAAGIAGCGASNSTGAAHCLTQALEYFGPGLCRTRKPEYVYVRLGGKLIRGGRGAEVTSSSCINQAGNVYTCTVAEDDGSTHAYSVTYDGSRIAFRQTSSSGGITIPTST